MIIDIAEVDNRGLFSKNKHYFEIFIEDTINARLNRMESSLYRFQCSAKLKCWQNWVVEFSPSQSLFLDQICIEQKLLQFFQCIESCNSEVTFVCAAFRIISIQDNKYFVEVKIKG